MKSDDLQGLLDVCLLGDANAQRLLWKACGDKLYAWILTEWSCLQDADARAIACEAFAEALLNLPKFRREVKFETWLCGIARHIAADYLRRLCLHKNDVSLDAVPEEALYRRRRRSEKSSLHDEMRAALRDVMLLVTHEQAVAVTLRFGSLLSPAVAAAQMGRSRLAFNMLVFRATPMVKRVCELRKQGVDPLRALGEGTECAV